jgi:hypothetical protein
MYPNIVNIIEIKPFVVLKMNLNNNMNPIENRKMWI